MSEFLLVRLFGLAQIADGIIRVFTPFRPGLALKTARHLARLRGSRMLR